MSKPEVPCFVKALALLGRAAKFCQSEPWPIRKDNRAWAEDLFSR